MASETIVAVFATESLAELAIDDLKSAGVSASSIEHFSQANQTGVAPTSAGETGRSHSGFWSWLTGETDESTSTHAAYDNSLSSGHTVVTVVADSARADEITSLLDRHKPLDIDHHSGAYEPGIGAATGELSGRPAMTGNLSPTTPAQTSDAAIGGTGETIGTGASVGSTGEQVLSLSEETLQVGKREIDRGTTRVRRFVVERPVEEQIRLRDERVSVFRRPVTGTVGIGDSFSDKVIEVTETDEEAVVGKTSRVVEEVVVQKAVDERVETIKDTVRHEDVEIDKSGGTTTTTSTPTAVR